MKVSIQHRACPGYMSPQCGHQGDISHPSPCRVEADAQGQPGLQSGRYSDSARQDKEMAQQFTVLVALQGELGSIPSIYMGFILLINSRPGDPMTSSDLRGHQACKRCTPIHTYKWCMHIQTCGQNTHSHKSFLKN